MAQITMSLSGGISLSTDKKTDTIKMAANDADQTVLDYELSILKFSFHKKMYQPTEVVADISIVPSTGKSNEYQEISREALEDKFKHAQVTLTEGTFSIGDDFYVHEVLPHYGKDSMSVMLKIYSLDKLLTVEGACRTFVAKKLGKDILASELSNYIAPWTIDKERTILDNQIAAKKDEIRISDFELEEAKDPFKVPLFPFNFLSSKALIIEKEKKLNQLKAELKELEAKRAKKKAKKIIAYKTANMHILKYGEDKEHIFPYLVQYNESFYDLLARTTNRWGEFLYYENGMLNIGYDATAEPIEVERKDIEDISFGDLNDKSLILATDGTYDYEADNSSLAGEPIQESPYYVRGQMVDFGGVPDKWVMKQFPGIFMNDKNLPTLMTNLLFDNWYYLCMKEGRTAKRNADHDERYFKNRYGAPEQYNDNYTFHRDYDESETVTASAFQEFTELDSEFTGKKYKEIVEKELTSGRNAIYINYGTTNPQLKLGSIITFGGKKYQYIVVDISGSYDANHDLVFKVVATAKDADGLFYPAVIPSGHVRYAHPQVATITDAKDSTRRNRVRVMFSWQDIKYNDEEKKKDITDGTKKLSSPWLTFASGQQGHPMAGKHYEGDHVMVGFQEGNVERPYVIGGLAEEDCRHLNIDSILTSRGMHKLILSDGTGAGMEAFLGGAVSPLAKTFMNFAPGVIPFMKWEKTKYFEGGFELSDYYGTYRFTGSTDGRNVSIASNWGDMKINAFTGIKISSPNGDVNISGKNVTIKAGNNLKLVSGKNVNYKLWKSENTARDTAEQLLLDWGLQIGKRLAEVGHPLDLSIVRSAVEIFFRPVEGSLEVKSNRFLKLEAGNSSSQLPIKAYSVEKQNQLLQDEVDQIKSRTIAHFQDIPVLIKVVECLTVRWLTSFFRTFQTEVEGRDHLDTRFGKLKEVANDPSKPVCKTFDELKDKLWSQTENVNWTEAEFGFTDNVAIEGDPKKIVNPSLYADLIASNIGAPDTSVVERVCNEIIEKRKELREYIVLAFNNRIRRVVFCMTHYDTETMEEIYRLINELYNKFIGKEDKPEDVPETYKQLFLNAISREKCPKAVCYDIPEELKNFNDRWGVSLEHPMEKCYMRRLSVMNLLEELGFTDDMRDAIVVGGAKPPKPQADKMDASDEKNIMNDECWENYVKSLKTLPLVDVKDPLKKTEPSFLKAQWDKINFLKGALEIKNWGEGKDGQILFGSGKDTYALNDSKLEKTINRVIVHENDVDFMDSNLLRDIKDRMLELKNI